MSNQIAIRCQTEPGDLILAERRAHAYLVESGGPAALSGATIVGLESDRGIFSAEQVRAAVRAPHPMVPDACYPVGPAARRREHPQRCGRRGMAARCPAGRRGHCARARTGDPPRRGAPLARHRSHRDPREPLRRGVRHGERLFLQGAGCPDGFLPRGSRAADPAGAPFPPALRRRLPPGRDRRGRRSARPPNTTGSGSPMTTAGRAGWPRACTNCPGSRWTSTGWRRTSSVSGPRG